MPTARARRTVSAAPDAVWALAGDPRHLPRWWPRAARVESVSGSGFTLVLLSKRGREVRADQRVTVTDAPRRRAWALELEGSPFERLFAESETELTLLAGADGGTEVRLALRQRLRGVSRFGGFLVRRASRRQLREALRALEAELRVRPAS